MCDMCPDDEYDIQTHRDRMEYWLFKIGVAEADKKIAIQQFESSRKDLRRRLRKGMIRNA